MISPMRCLAFALVLGLAPLSAVAAGSAEQAALVCEIGPVQREFGASVWNIYACSDGKSIVVVPLAVMDGKFGYFFVTPNGQEVIVTGEGWGQDASFQPVFRQLKQITAVELTAMVQSAQAARPAASIAK